MNTTTPVAAPAITFVVAPVAIVTYAQGFNAYCDHASYFDMPTKAARKGWMAANKAEAEAGIVGYAERRGW